jgi:hypothetical protein
VRILALSALIAPIVVAAQAARVARRHRSYFSRDPWDGGAEGED